MKWKELSNLIALCPNIIFAHRSFFSLKKIYLEFKQVASFGGNGRRSLMAESLPEN